MKGYLSAALVVIAAAGFGLWWFSTFERVTEPVYVGLQGEARDDPFLALKLLLKRNHLSLEEPAVSAAPEVKFRHLPASGTLLLSDRRHLLMTRARVQALVDWVAHGGHLIVEAEYPGRPDPLLAAFGLSRAELGTAADRKLPRAAGGGNGGGNEITEINLPDAPRPLKVEFAAYQNLAINDATGSATLQAADARGLRFVSRQRGAGRVSALSNFDFMIYRGSIDTGGIERQPTHIGKFDHAEFIVRLIRLNPGYASAALRLVWCRDDVSLWDWLSAHAQLALISGGVLLLVWLAYVMPRFGPLVAALRISEQRLSSHLAAAGRFYLKYLGPAEVHDRLAAAFKQRLTQHRPRLAALAPGKRNAELASLAGVTGAAVARALDQPARNAAELVRDAMLLQRLSQKL